MKLNFFPNYERVCIIFNIKLTFTYFFKLQCNTYRKHTFYLKETEHKSAMLYKSNKCNIVVIIPLFLKLYYKSHSLKFLVAHSVRPIGGVHS